MAVYRVLATVVRGEGGGWIKGTDFRRGDIRCSKLNDIQLRGLLYNI